MVRFRNFWRGIGNRIKLKIRGVPKNPVHLQPHKKRIFPFEPGKKFRVRSEKPVELRSHDGNPIHIKDARIGKPKKKQ